MKCPCGVEAIPEARAAMPRYVCPSCGSWQYVATERPDVWVRTVKESLTVAEPAEVEARIKEPRQ